MKRAAVVDRIAIDYYRSLASYLQTLDKWLAALIQGLQPIYEDTYRADTARDVQKYLQDLLNKIPQPSTKALRAVAGKYAAATDKAQKADFARLGRKLVNVDITKDRRFNDNIEPALDAHIDENVKLIKSLPERMSEDIAAAVSNAGVSGKRWETLASELKDRMGVTESRAKLIARDQIGKLYGQINQVRQTNLGVEEYTWRIVNDNRVREEHENDYNGNVYKWSEPPSDGHPGDAINCRCYAEPVIGNIGLLLN